MKPINFAIPLTLIFIVLLTGCKNEPDREKTIVDQEPAETAHVHKANWANEIRLNNGSQWQANRETTEGILKMEIILKDNSASTAEEYRQLGDDLNAEKNTIIKKCTMEGPSHDNLHVYLVPLIDSINALRETRSTEEGKHLTTEIKHHLQAYHDYFI